MLTPAESPCSNGIVECHNAVLGKTVHKLMLDEKRYPIDVIVAWSVSTKNAWILAMVTVPTKWFLGGIQISHLIWQIIHQP